MQIYPAQPSTKTHQLSLIDRETELALLSALAEQLDDQSRQLQDCVSISQKMEATHAQASPVPMALCATSFTVAAVTALGAWSGLLPTDAVMATGPCIIAGIAFLARTTSGNLREREWRTQTEEIAQARAREARELRGQQGELEERLQPLRLLVPNGAERIREGQGFVAIGGTRVRRAGSQA
ncbi:MAG: hypothetical protein AMXMBFR33_33240 [Candidatus Xenobia bacterium]